MTSNIIKYDVKEILQHQCNRYPLLFIDKIVECDPGSSATGLKNYTYNEWFFPAHFEDEPNVPGFVQLESLVQTFLMTFLTLSENKGKKTNFISINNARFFKKVVPGDQVFIKAELKSFKRGIAVGSATGFVTDEIACSAEFKVAVPDVLNKFRPPSSEI